MKKMTLYILIIISICFQLILAQTSSLNLIKQNDIININSIKKIIGVTNKGNTRNIIYCEDGLFFCDDDLKILGERVFNKDRKSETIIASEKGSYILVYEDIAYDLSDDFPLDYSRKITLLNCQGNVIWSKDENFNIDDIELPIRKVSDYNGNMFELNTKSGTVKVIDTLGNEINSVVLFPDLKEYHDYRSRMVISTDGKFVIVLANKYQASPEKIQKSRYALLPKDHKLYNNEKVHIKRKNGEPTLFQFNHRGLLVKTKICEEEDALRVGSNENGSFLYYTTKNIDSEGEKYKSVVLDSNLDKVLKINSYINNFKIHKRDLYITTSGNFIDKYNMETKQLIFRKKLNNYPFEMKIDTESNLLSIICTDESDKKYYNATIGLDDEKLSIYSLGKCKYLGNDIFNNNQNLFKVKNGMESR